MLGLATAKSLLTGLALGGVNLINSEPCGISSAPEALVDTIVKQAPILDLSQPASELQQVVLKGRLACSRVYLIDKHKWVLPVSNPSCWIDRSLKEFLDREIERDGIDLIPYLEANDFSCTTRAKQAKCTNIFSFVEPRPRDWFTGKPINPDVNITILTNVCFQNPHPHGIKVIGVMFEESIRDGLEGK
jgi:hypothetical protein